MSISQEITIEAPHGMHMRPASEFAKVAKEFKSKVTFTSGEETVSAKSPLKIISLNLSKGSKVVLTCDGEDEAAAMEKLAALINTLE